MQAVLSEKGQITIPKSIRDELGLRPGEALDFIVDKWEIRVRKVAPVNPMQDVYGILKSKKSSDQILNDLRGSAED
ncbi:MAG: AbrB/MazE/SpoVT family DNA-binding domain-containing protein [Spirochaetia bacterium]|nr:AbrB/MazE/SpoVT family DNA-binding domain-containing protein [Spirochaetia bacterium]